MYGYTWRYSYICIHTCMYRYEYNIYVHIYIWYLLSSYDLNLLHVVSITTRITWRLGPRSLLWPRELLRWKLHAPRMLRHRRSGSLRLQPGRCPGDPGGSRGVGKSRGVGWGFNGDLLGFYSDSLGFNGDLMGFKGIYPLVITNIAIETGHL